MRIVILRAVTMRTVSALVVCAGLLFNTSAQASATDDPQTIMDRVDLLQREASDSTLTQSGLSSCSFAIKAKKVTCTETPRTRSVESLSRQLGANKKDSQSISILLAPASERGIGMLTYSYDDETRDIESWLYLSALGKVKRMASGTGEDREPVSLFGSEFTTEDMENGKTDEYNYEILQAGQYGGQEVWVIEATPKPVRYKKTNYSKWRYWIDQTRYVMLKAQAYDKRGTLHKRLMFKHYQEIKGHWHARDITVYNLKKQRLSTMKLEKLAVDIELDPEFLTQRTLTDFAFREQHLQTLRQFFQ